MDYFEIAQQMYERGLDLDNSVGFHATSVRRFAKIIVEQKVRGRNPFRTDTYASVDFHSYIPGLRKNLLELLPKVDIDSRRVFRYDIIVENIRCYAEGATFIDDLSDINEYLAFFAEENEILPLTGLYRLKEIGLIGEVDIDDSIKLRKLTQLSIAVRNHGYKLSYIGNILKSALENHVHNRGIVFSLNPNVVKYSVDWHDPEVTEIKSEEIDFDCINGFQFYPESSMDDLRKEISDLVAHL